MAETKTNIPIEIKMGNAGTNNSNLPAFKEGSIIFTKDTKKIYIDPVGETERIAVGGAEVDLSGKQDVFSVVEGKKVEDNVTIVLKDFEYFDKTLKELIKASKSTDSVQIQLPKDARNMLGGIKQIHNGEIGSSTVEVVFGNGTISLIGAAGGKVTLSGIEAGKNVNDAVNVAQLNNKQGLFCDVIPTTGGQIITMLTNYRYWDEEKQKFITTSQMLIPQLGTNYVQFRTPSKNGTLRLTTIGRGNNDAFRFSGSRQYVDLVPDDGKIYTGHESLAFGNHNGDPIQLKNIAAPTTDNDAVTLKYLQQYYGTRPYDATSNEFYLPGGSNIVIPNTAMGRLFMGSEGARSTDFKIYVNDPIDNGKLIITNLKTPVNDEDAANKAYVDTQVATKQAKFAEYTSTRPSEEAPASASTNILVLNEGTKFYLRDRATNPLVEFSIADTGALEGTTNYISLISKEGFHLKTNTFNLSNDKGTPFQVVMDDSKKIVYYGLSGGDDNGSLYLTRTSRTAQQGATLQGNVSSDSRTTALVVNESNTKLLSWKQGTTTNNAPLLGVSTPVEAADTSKGITANDLDYQAVNKKYVDDIKTELLKAINHPYTYDETTKELTLIL